MTQKKAPKTAPKKKYYKTKNDVIEELKSELEAAEFLHREQIAKMQIEHQEELDAARHKDEEVFKLNLCELPSDTEEFCKDLAAHPQIEDVEQHRFGLNENGVGDIIIDVITFHWLDPLDSEEDLRYGKYYKFDVWHGPATNYELIRWSDQPYSG